MTNIDVELDVRNSENKDPGNGFINTNSNTGPTYCYKYTGGTDGNGDVTIASGTGPITITVKLIADRNYYSITGLTFWGADISDLSYSIESGAGKVVITDTDISDLDDRYAVQIYDQVAHTLVSCDPMIKNKPS